MSILRLPQLVEHSGHLRHRPDPGSRGIERYSHAGSQCRIQSAALCCGGHAYPRPKDHCIDLWQRSAQAATLFFNGHCAFSVQTLFWDAFDSCYPHSADLIQRCPSLITHEITLAGKIVVTGGKTEDQTKTAARRFARIIQKCGFPRVKLVDFRCDKELYLLTQCSAIAMSLHSDTHLKSCWYGFHTSLHAAAGVALCATTGSRMSWPRAMSSLQSGWKDWFLSTCARILTRTCSSFHMCISVCRLADAQACMWICCSVCEQEVFATYEPELFPGLIYKMAVPKVRTQFLNRQH
eukprot:SAG11_NODE_127_length_15677_cov_10.890872_3_plen_294_part_00